MSEIKNQFKRVSGIVTSRFMSMFVPDLEDKSKGIHKYGKKNDLPNQLISAIADSGVATRAARKVAEYIASDGFVDEKSAKFKVNENQTADQLLQELSVYMAMLNGVAFHISRQGGKVKSVKALPVQCLRKKISGGYVYNPTYGQERFDTSKDVHYPEFVKGALSTKQLESKAFDRGEILYLYVRTPFNTHYPVPDWYSQVEDVRTSGEIAKMDYELSINGFMPSSIITLVGRIDDTNKDDAGKTDLDYLHEDLRVFTGQEKNSNGLSGRFKALVHHVATKDDVPNIQSFDIKAILESSNSKREVIERAVCRLFGVHPVLLGYSDAAVLGNQQALANAALELNKVVNPFQRLITEAFTMIFEGFDWTISEYMPINYVPDALLQDMTRDERRQKFLGLMPLPEQQNTPQTPTANGGTN